jgi:hypothetical protein
MFPGARITVERDPMSPGARITVERDPMISGLCQPVEMDPKSREMALGPRQTKNMKGIEFGNCFKLLGNSV